MEDAREVEFKRRIPDRVAFEALRSAAEGRVDADLVQENHFFDTRRGDLAAQGIGLRLRRSGGHDVVCVKGPREPSCSGEPATRFEVEWSLGPSVADGILRTPARIREALVGRHPEGGQVPIIVRRLYDSIEARELERIGSFRNVRTVVHTVLRDERGELAAVLEFDCTQFTPNRIDYEVELEIPRGAPADRYRSALDALLRSVGIEPVDGTDKLQRFRETLAHAPQGEVSR